MAVVTQPETNPTIGASPGTIAPGLAGNFRPAMLAYMGSVDAKIRLVQGYLEQLLAAFGQGALTGGTIAAAGGLSVSVTPLKAYVGNFVALDASGTVGGLTNGATNRLWLRQDATFSLSQDDNVPGTADGHGTAMCWGSVECSGGTVATVYNNRRYLGQNISFVSPWAGTPGTVNNGDIWINTLDACALYHCWGGTVYQGTAVKGTVAAGGGRLAQPISDPS